MIGKVVKVQASLDFNGLSWVPTGPQLTGESMTSPAKSAGAIGLPDVNVAFQDANGSHISMLVSKKGNIRLVKGSQIVFRVTGP